MSDKAEAVFTVIGFVTVVFVGTTLFMGAVDALFFELPLLKKQLTDCRAKLAAVENRL